MALGRDHIAQALPNYVIGEEVGRGAWGVVIKGEHRRLGREVAIKELPQAFAADPGVQHRFASEARLLASLKGDERKVADVAIDRRDSSGSNVRRQAVRLPPRPDAGVNIFERLFFR